MNCKIFLKRIIMCIALTAMTIGMKAHDYFFKPLNKDFDRIAMQLNKLDFENRRTGIKEEQLQRLEQLAEKTDNSQLKVRTLYWRVRSTQMDAQPMECIAMLEQARKLCKEDYDYDLACVNYQLAGNYDRMGRYMDAYTILQSAIVTFDKYGDNYFLGNAYLLLAQLFMDINDTANAVQPLSQAKKAYAKAGFPLDRIYFFEAALTTDPEQKFALYRQALSRNGQDWGMDVQSLTAMAHVRMSIGRYDEAMTYVNSADSLLKVKAPDNIIFNSIVAVERARVLFGLGDCSKVVSLMSQELENLDRLQGERLLTSIYELLWRAYEAQGDMTAAYRFLKDYQEVYKREGDSLRSQEIPKAQAREAIARHTDSIRILEQDAELSRRFMYMAMLICVVILLAGIAVFVYFYQRYKIRQLENRELRNSLEQEALIYSLNRKNFENDIKQKNCEISSSTLLLANKNEVLQQISDITRRYQEKGSIPQDYVKQVNDVIGDSLRNDDEWQRFKLHFDSVHPEFFVKLKAQGTGLTENDLRLCAYIRIGMRAKQIAEMLSVSPDSVNSNRYRLRKKFQMQKGDSLDDFIRSI